jgi:hypothetical protein
LRKFLANNGLTVALAALFLLSLTGHWLSGWKVENSELSSHGQPEISLAEYTSDAQFLSTVFENWESEFLQMGMYVLLTAMLVQRGSAESKDPDEPEAQPAPGPDSPAASRAGPAVRWVYAHSLSIALLTMFVCSFLLHWNFSAEEAASQARLHGEDPETKLQYLASPQLWFESFQNWQSEFLSTAVLVVLSIFLRQKGSPESKPVTAPHSQTGG